MTRQDGGPLLQKGDNLKSPPTSDRKWMSVKEMGDLLGIRKTDRYWLVHKKVFKTETINGKMWVNVESFEKWYANQVKYQKITGEEPGLELKEWSLSPRDAAKLLGIPEARVYELIKEKSLEAVKVDYWLRIKKDSFTEWYQNQDHYRTTEDRERDQDLEDATLSFPQAALILGLTRHQFYPILKDKRYAHFFEFVEIAGRRRITKASFGRFLNGQDKYCIAKKRKPKKPTAATERMASASAEYKTKEEWLEAKEIPLKYLTIEEASKHSGITPQAISRYAMRGYFGECRKAGGRVRIPEKQFKKWLKERQEGELINGFN